MCGIAGIISADPREINTGRLKAMTDAIAHRGPDGEGQWINPSGEVGLAHRRLSIIDLSNAGSQPMHYMGRYSIVFNGEIYNYIEIKERLLKKGYSFVSDSDTEVLLALYDERKEQCLEELDGMFAFVIWDEQERTVFCARDRFGEKPFFYTWQNGTFYFASEMKCLWAAGIVPQENKAMLYNYLAYGLVYHPKDPATTFFEGVYKLPFGYCMTMRPGQAPKIAPYWQLELPQEPSRLSFDEAKEAFAGLMRESVQRRLRSDVPVGSSLSGGLDSSIIVAIINELNAHGKITQKTFSARFPGFGKDESKYIDKVLSVVKAEGFSTYPDGEDFLNRMDDLFYHQEEPYGSASIFAQWKVMELAKMNQVTVLLDGQGADEILAGYSGYYSNYFQELLRTDRRLYKEEWKAYETLQSQTIKRGPIFYMSAYRGDNSRLAMWLKNRRDNVFRKDFNRDFIAAQKEHSLAGANMSLPSLNATLQQSITSGGLETLLRYADRNSMAHSREVRLPFLSHKLVEFLFSLPASYKISKGWTKMLAREAFDHLLPEEIIWRKEKVGYEPPQKKWMEDARITEAIRAARETLVARDVFDKKVLDKPIVGHGTSTRESNTWAELMGGKLLQFIAK